MNEVDIDHDGQISFDDFFESFHGTEQEKSKEVSTIVKENETCCFSLDHDSKVKSLVIKELLSTIDDSIITLNRRNICETVKKKNYDNFKCIKV